MTAMLLAHCWLTMIVTSGGASATLRAFYGLSAAPLQDGIKTVKLNRFHLVYLALGPLTLFIIWRARRTTSRLAPKALLPKTPRVLKPRTPRDCPLCRQPHPTPLLGKVHKPGVKPWRAGKSRRGPSKRVCTAGHACPNPACDYHGNTEATFHALVGNGLRKGVQQFKCQACRTRFSCRLGTALFRLRTSARAIGQALLAFNLGLSAAEVQLRMGHSDTTLVLRLDAVDYSRWAYGSFGGRSSLRNGGL